LIADSFGLIAPILAIGLLTLASSLIVRFRMHCVPKSPERLPDSSLKPGLA
jgi:hypothetical protein